MAAKKKRYMYPSGPDEVGTTQRDGFAGLAMHAMISKGDWDWDAPEQSAARATFTADHMVRALDIFLDPADK